jgi:hypothetical protein
MQASHCLNCDTAITPSQKHCPACGQKTDTKRLTIKTLLVDFFQSLFNLEKGLLHLGKDLATQPGTVAINYIKGKRKQYFNPFGFLAMAVAFSIFTRNWFSSFETLPKADITDMSKMPDGELKNLAKVANEKAIGFEHFFDENMNLITVFIMPYVAFMLWLFFRHRQRNFSEITLAYILFSSFGIIVSSVLTYLPMTLFRSYTSFTVLLWVNLLLQTIYHTWGMKVFFNYKTTGGFFKVFGVFMLTGLIGCIAIFIFLLYYVYDGNWDLIYFMSQHKR